MLRRLAILLLAASCADPGCLQVDAELRDRIGGRGVEALYRATEHWAPAADISLDTGNMCPNVARLGDAHGNLAEGTQPKTGRPGGIVFDRERFDAIKIDASDCVDGVGILLEELATHEIGHFLGIDFGREAHPSHKGHSRRRSETMHPGRDQHCDVKPPSTRELDLAADAVLR